ncbi:isopentenyl-diphosphate Delta-isomerase [Rothia halotolerans]|uniref:isopentenyl-diphosphate Delta-isomerase n=1 Tax=Rothia halotolerans TaxID=405770 RepID=UPI00101DBA65|nr:isopentenyl-diphosphate Delta-isomerase [Rothia halotolerans]
MRAESRGDRPHPEGGREAGEELVVLLDAANRPAGTFPKARVHTGDTPRHLAFSCYVLDAEGRLLLTRRALGKRTWPGTWSNSLCGHPGPEEPMPEAILRRARQELGMELTGLREVLPEFAYRAVDASGIVENEFCPVYVARAASDPDPRPTEVCEISWVPARDAVAAVRAVPAAFSPWMGWQLEQPDLRRALAG